MPAPSRSQTLQSERAPSLRDPGDEVHGAARDQLAQAIRRRPGVSWWAGLLLAAGFAALVVPAITAERMGLRTGTITADRPAPFTVRAPMLRAPVLAGEHDLRVRGGVVVARGETPGRERAAIADAIAEAMPRGPLPYLALFGLVWALAAIFTHHVRRSRNGRLLRVQIVSLATIAVVAVAAKLVLLSTAASALVVPVAALAIVPTLALDRVVGLATGILAALVVSLLAPFDVGLAILLLVQAATAGLVIADRPRRPWLAALTAGLGAALCTVAAYVLLAYLTAGTTGPALDLRDPLHAPWLAAAIGATLAGVIAVPLVPLYQRMTGEITRGTLVALEDLGHPLLRQIAERAPGTWQHSLMLANMAEIAANAIGANGRLVRVGAYFHDLGKSLQPPYFVENLAPGETSPHDRLPPEVSCDAIFAHVAGGIAAARKARLHERIVDFMHMHHGSCVLEPLWVRCQAQGNPNAFTVERFRYPGHPPQSRETAILAICDALEAASRTLHKPDAAAIDALVERTVHHVLDLGQLDDSGLSMADLRQISDALRERLRHANRAHVDPPRHRAAPLASASATAHTHPLPQPAPLDRKPDPDAPAALTASTDDALAATADLKDSGERHASTPRAARAASESNETRIRAGTARNAHAAPPDADGAGRDPVRAATPRNVLPAPPDAEDTGRDLVRAATSRTAPAAARAADPREIARASNEVVTIIPRRHATERPRAAPDHASLSTLGDASATDRSARADASPATADHRGSVQAAMTTLPGRAPGPKPQPPPPAPDLITAALFASQPLSTPISSQPPSPLAAQPLGSQPLPVALSRATSPSKHPRPPTSPPVMPARHPTADPTRAADPTRPDPTRAVDPTRAADPTRAERPPSPDAVEHAAASPPTLRRAPGPAVTPADPAQIAAALAAIVSRVSAAPFGMPRAPEGRPPTATPSTGVDPAIAQPPALDDDARITLPRIATQPPNIDLPLAHDARVTDPRGSADPSDLDTRVTDPRGAAAAPDLDGRATDERPAAAAPGLDAGTTEPSMRALDIGDERSVDQLPAPAAASRAGHEPARPWSHRVAAGVDAALVDEWSHETPVVAPTSAELRALFGQPDPTRQLPLEEVELLQRRAAELAESDRKRRPPPPTAEVDPEDIEAAIELAPPARRPVAKNTIGVNRPKKTE